MGIRLLRDLTEALNLTTTHRSGVRLTETDLPAVLAKVGGSYLPSGVRPRAVTHFLRLSRRYDPYLATLSECLLVPLPSWTSPRDSRRENGTPRES
jgi:hypothetical protein